MTGLVDRRFNILSFLLKVENAATRIPHSAFRTPQ